MILQVTVPLTINIISGVPFDQGLKQVHINGEVIHLSTYQSLNAQELNDEEDLWHGFDKKIEEKLGPKATVKDFDDMNMEETPTFEMYGDNYGVERTPDKIPEDLEPTPNLSKDVYLNASIFCHEGKRSLGGGRFS